MIGYLRKARTAFQAVRKKRIAKRKVSLYHEASGKEYVRLARIGLGRRGQVLDNAILEMEEVVVVAAYDSNPELMEKFCRPENLHAKADPREELGK